MRLPAALASRVHASASRQAGGRASHISLGGREEMPGMSFSNRSLVIFWLLLLVVVGEGGIGANLKSVPRAVDGTNDPPVQYRTNYHARKQQREGWR